MKQTSLVKSKGITKSIELFKSYCCKKCGSAEVDVFKSNNSICLKCDDCNERVIFRTDDKKQGALEELKKLLPRFETFESCEYKIKLIIEKRIKELEGDKK